MSPDAGAEQRKAPRRRTLLVWGVLLLLVGTIAAVEYRERTRPTNELDEFVARALVPVASSSQIGVVEVFYQGILHRFERDDSGAWFYHGHGAESASGVHAHLADPRLSPAIEKAFLGLSRARMERQFPRGPLEKDYGTAAPEMFVMLYPPKELKPLARIAVGRVAPDGISRYVLPDGSRFVVTIPDYQIQNLLALLKTAAGQMTPAELDGILSGGSPGVAAPSPVKP